MKTHPGLPDLPNTDAAPIASARVRQEPAGGQRPFLTIPHVDEALGILEKLGVRTRAEAVATAYALGIVSARGRREATMAVNCPAASSARRPFVSQILQRRQAARGRRMASTNSRLRRAGRFLA